MSDPSLWRTDTHFLCAICIEWVAWEDAGIDPLGDKWDMCQDCVDRDMIAKVMLFMTQGRVNNHV